MKKKGFKIALIYAVIFFGVIFLLEGLQLFDSNDTKEINYGELLGMIEKNELGKISFKELVVSAWLPEKATSSDSKGTLYSDAPDYICNVESYEKFEEAVIKIIAKQNNKSVDEVNITDGNFVYEYIPDDGEPFFLLMLPYIFIIGTLILCFVFFSKAQGGNSAMAFSKSRAKVQMSGDKTFADVEGADEEKEELSEIVDFMKNPKKYTDMGARIPKGVLLVGAPGTGKTLLAKAVAGEAKVPFYSISGSDFVEMFVGVGASRVRDLFNTAKKTAPSVVFIDEIDAVGRQRGAGLGGGHDEREQTLNQLLVEMDGFAPNEGIIVMAATNRPDVLDPALLRPGRFDRQITVNMPDIVAREAILKLHAKNKKFDDTVKFDEVAKLTGGFSGADLENLLNEAAILATRRNKDVISITEINDSVARVLLGPEKKKRRVTEQDKKITAFHEAGHAIAAMLFDGCDPLREVSIIPRGMAGGYTLTVPDDDYSYMSKGKLLDEIAMSLGGRAAELIVFNEISTGASSDLKRATSVARDMVIKFGMSDKIGPIFLGGDQEVFMGRDFAQHTSFSDAFGEQVDCEIKDILETQYERVQKLLKDNREAMDRVVEVLVRREYMTGEQFTRIFNGESEEDVFAA